MTQLVLIRHAQSANNALPEHQRVCDPGLTQLGIQQALLTATALRDTPLTHLYCSPFLRSLETARPLAEALRLPVAIRADLFEQGGCYSGHESGKERGEAGMSRGELAMKYPHWDVDQRIGEAGWWGRAYESLDQTRQRAQKVVDWIQRDIVPQRGVHAMIVHADFKRILLSVFFSAQARALIPILGPLHNVGITRLEWVDPGWRLLSLNATSHLPAAYVT